MEFRTTLKLAHALRTPAPCVILSCRHAIRIITLPHLHRVTCQVVAVQNVESINIVLSESHRFVMRTIDCHMSMQTVVHCFVLGIPCVRALPLGPLKIRSFVHVHAQKSHEGKPKAKHSTAASPLAHPRTSPAPSWLLADPSQKSAIPLRCHTKVLADGEGWLG